MKGSKVRLNALIDFKTSMEMQKEVQQRYITDEKVTMSSLANEILTNHYKKD